MRGSKSNKMKTKINFLIEQINGMGFITSRIFIMFLFDGVLETTKHNINRVILQESGDFTWKIFNSKILTVVISRICLCSPNFFIKMGCNHFLF